MTHWHEANIIKLEDLTILFFHDIIIFIIFVILNNLFTSISYLLVNNLFTSILLAGTSFAGIIIFFIPNTEELLNNENHL